MTKSKTSKEKKSPKAQKQIKFLKRFLGPTSLIYLKNMSGWDLGHSCFQDYKKPYVGKNEFGMTHARSMKIVEQLFDINARLMIHMSSVRALYLGVDHLAVLNGHPEGEKVKKHVKTSLYPIVQMMKDNNSLRWIYEYSIGNEIPIRVDKLMEEMERLDKQGILEESQSTNKEEVNNQLGNTSDNGNGSNNEKLLG